MVAYLEHALSFLNMSPSEKLKLLSKNLTTDHPRSPRDTLAGYVIAARTLDKCRAVLSGTAGEYHFDCPLDRQFFGFAGIKADDFRSLVATGATDKEVGSWIENESTVKDRTEQILWNNRLRHTRPCDMPTELQVFLEGYIERFIPRNRPVHVWFDVYDLEEERI
jgi:hypothetical protein